MINLIKKLFRLKPSIVTNQFSKEFLIISKNDMIYYFYVPYEIQDKISCFNWNVNKDNKAYNVFIGKELYQYIKDNIEIPLVDYSYLQYTDCFNKFMNEVKDDSLKIFEEFNIKYENKLEELKVKNDNV